jgi:hypothetical protein
VSPKNVVLKTYRSPENEGLKIPYLSAQTGGLDSLGEI